MDPPDHTSTRSDRVGSLVQQVTAGRGALITIELSGDDLDELLERLRAEFRAGADDVDVLLILGAAATTASDAIAQLVAALRLPYRATGGWDDFYSCLWDRPAALRECIVVADAERLLVGDPEARQELIDRMHEATRCLGGGWQTLVLATGTAARLDGRPRSTGTAGAARR